MIEVEVLPESWTTAPLGLAVEKPQYGLTASAVKKPVGPKLLRITDIQNDSVNWSTVPHCNCVHNRLDKYRLHVGDIVVARIGATTGKSYLVTDDVNAVFASYLIRFRANESVFPEYLYYFTKSDGYWRQIDAAKGGKLKQGINLPILTDLQIPLPPLPEQRAIARVLRTVQEAKEKTEAVIAAAKELKKSLMKHLFTYGPVPVDQADQVKLKETEIGPVPEDWEVVELGVIAQIKSGGTPSRGVPEYWNGEIPWVKTGEVNYSTIMETEEKITDAGVQNSSARLVPSGTLLMAMYGQGVTRGRVAILGIDATVNQACAAFFPDERVDTRFLYQRFSFDYDRLRSVSHGAHQKNLSSTLLQRFLIGFPSRADQSQISTSLEVLQRKLDVEQNRLSALDQLFKTLLHDLMTAKIRVHDLAEAAP